MRVGFGAQSHLVIHFHMSRDLVHTVRQESAHDEMHDRHLEQGAGESVQNTLLKALVQPGKVSARLVFQVVDRRPLYFDLIAIPVISDVWLQGEGVGARRGHRPYKKVIVNGMKPRKTEGTPVLFGIQLCRSGRPWCTQMQHGQ